MLSNFWKGLTFYCINGHEHPIEMIYKEGGTLFFACPKYMLVDDEHPDGHERYESACPNRLSYPDAEKIVSMMADAVQNSLAGDDEEYDRHYPPQYRFFSPSFPLFFPVG